MNLKKNWLLVAGILVFAVGCSKSDSNSTDTTPPPTGSTGVAGTNTSTGSTTGSTTPPTAASYSAVQAIFTKSCVGCHGAANGKAGINLTTYEGAMKGGMEGPVITAGDPDHSKLIDALRGRPGAKQMPMKAPKLAEDQIKLIEDWIKAGAKNE